MAHSYSRPFVPLIDPRIAGQNDFSSNASYSRPSPLAMTDPLDASQSRKDRFRRLSPSFTSTSPQPGVLTTTRRPGHQSLRPSPPRTYHRELSHPSPLVIEPSPCKDDVLCPPVTSPNQKSSSLVSSSQAFWLLLYFCFNLGLTLYNKGVLFSFPFPYTLTAIHALFGTIGAGILLRNGSFTPVQLSLQENLVILAFSVLYSVNIIVSNASLHLVTIPVRHRLSRLFLS